MTCATHKLDTIIASLVDIKWQLKTGVGAEEFEDVRNKLLDARELIRATMDMLNKMDLQSNTEDYKDKILESIIKKQNTERQKIHAYFLVPTLVSKRQRTKRWSKSKRRAAAKARAMKASQAQNNAND